MNYLEDKTDIKDYQSDKMLMTNKKIKITNTMSNNNRHIAFLLGAGFSVPTGLPTANTLNKLIISEIYNRIRKSFKEGEEGILQSFILEKVLIDIDEYGEFNYELYYDFLEQEKEKNLDSDRLLSFIERGM